MFVGQQKYQRCDTKHSNNFCDPNYAIGLRKIIFIIDWGYIRTRVERSLVAWILDTVKIIGNMIDPKHLDYNICILFWAEHRLSQGLDQRPFKHKY